MTDQEASRLLTVVTQRLWILNTETADLPGELRMCRAAEGSQAIEGVEPAGMIDEAFARSGFTPQIPTTSRQVLAIRAWPASEGWTPSPAQ